MKDVIFFLIYLYVNLAVVHFFFSYSLESVTSPDYLMLIIYFIYFAF